MLDALLTAWKAAVAPRATAELLVRVGPRAALAVILLHAVLAGLLAAGTYWVVQTRTIVWVPTPVTARTARATTRPATGPATRPAQPIWTMPTPRERRRTLAQVWADLHADRWFGPLERVAISEMAIVLVWLALLAGMFLSAAHQGQSLVASLRRAIAVVAPASAVVLLMIAVMVGAQLLSHFGFRELPVLPSGTSTSDASYLVVLPWGLIASLLCAGTIASHVAPRDAPREPRCEHCGYDLTGSLDSPRCPECGHAVDESLGSPNRKPTPWEAARSAGRLAAWIETTRVLLFEPRAFYRRLRGYDPLPGSWAYERFTFGVLFVVTGISAAGLVVHLDNPARPVREGLFVFLASGWFVLAAWLGHRLLGAAAVVRWILATRAADGRPAARVISYESCFVWLVALWTATITLSVILAGPWISGLLDPARAATGRAMLVLGVPIDIWVLFGGVGGLVVVWLMRYSIALREVRWANA